MTNEMHSSYNQFLFVFHRFLSALNVSNESSRSSSGARHNILYYTVQAVQSCYQASLAALAYSILCRAPDDERLDSFEACRADKKLWNKN